MSEPNFWDDKEKADLTLKDISELKNLTQDIQKLKDFNQNNLELIELLLVEKDETLLHNLEEEVSLLCQKMEKAEIFLLLSGPYDKNNCILNPDYYCTCR